MKQATPLDAFDLAGYLPGTPPRMAAECVNIDADACASSACSSCGHAGVTFRPFSNEHGSYLAFAVCPACGHAMEF